MPVWVLGIIFLLFFWLSNIPFYLFFTATTKDFTQAYHKVTHPLFLVIISPLLFFNINFLLKCILISFSTTSNEKYALSELFFLCSHNLILLLFPSEFTNYIHPMAHSSFCIRIVDLFLLHFMINLLIVWSNNSDEHIKEQQIKQNHEYYKKNRNECIITPVLLQFIIIKVANNHFKAGMNSVEYRGEALIFKAKYCIPPNRKSK